MAPLTSCAYLEQHRADNAAQSYSFTQIGRVEIYGPFDNAILQRNQAWPYTPEDAALIQESYAVAIAQPVVVNGQLIYPPQPQHLRVIRIAHYVRGFANQEPAPAWTGPVIHERTVVPWSNDSQARFENQWRYEQRETTFRNDRPKGRTIDDAPPPTPAH